MTDSTAPAAATANRRRRCASSQYNKGYVDA
ncbi:hypothetical protein M2336_001764 [Sphingobium sp. B1D7B]|nr:hypothetical protein [Sphingobium sp. B1D7B]